MEGRLGTAAARNCWEGRGHLESSLGVVLQERRVGSQLWTRGWEGSIVWSTEVFGSVLSSWGSSTGGAGYLHLGMGTFYREIDASENNGSRVSVKAGDEEAEHSEKMEAMGQQGQ